MRVEGSNRSDSSDFIFHISVNTVPASRHLSTSPPSQRRLLLYFAPYPTLPHIYTLSPRLVLSSGLPSVLLWHLWNFSLAAQSLPHRHSSAPGLLSLSLHLFACVSYVIRPLELTR